MTCYIQWPNSSVIIVIYLKTEFSWQSTSVPIWNDSSFAIFGLNHSMRERHQFNEFRALSLWWAQVTLPFDVQPQEPAATWLDSRLLFLLLLPFLTEKKRKISTSQVLDKAKFSRRAGALWRVMFEIWTCYLATDLKDCLKSQTRTDKSPFALLFGWTIYPLCVAKV